MHSQLAQLVAQMFAFFEKFGVRSRPVLGERCDRESQEILDEIAALNLKSAEIFAGI